MLYSKKKNEQKQQIQLWNKANATDPNSNQSIAKWIIFNTKSEVDQPFVPGEGIPQSAHHY